MDAPLGCDDPQPVSREVTAGALTLDRVTRRFGGAARPAVEDLSLEIAAGELLALIGASGSGKTTTLRMIAGYELPDAGRIHLDGRDITVDPPQRREFGMVFQHYALFPHLSVEENVAFGLEARGVGTDARRGRARETLALVGLEGAGPRPVQSLSGGEQQRVALARAIVIEPKVLLLDEPLSNLDAKLRRAMRDELRSMLRRLGMTALFVTHDQEDAFAVADRVALMRGGRLLQVGTPEELYDKPANAEVAEFIGRAALVHGRYEAGRVTLDIAGRRRTVRATALRPPRAADVVLAVIRPDALEIVDPDGEDRWLGTILDRRFSGTTFIYRVRLDDGPELEVHTARRSLAPDDRIGVWLAREPVAVVPR